MINVSDIDIDKFTKYIPQVMDSALNSRSAEILKHHELRDAFRTNMMASKSWLISKFLDLKLDTSARILIVGGWLGFTSYVLFKNGYENVTEIDTDSRLEEFSINLNKDNTKFKHYVCDINEFDSTKFDVIINSSCEHIGDNSWFERDYDKKCIFILQSTNMDYIDHVNKSDSLEDMASKYKLNLIYSDVLSNLGKSSRFMLIGTK